VWLFIDELAIAKRNAPMKSLYVHFPFCESKCHYCDFYSLGREKTKAGDADAFEKALHAEALQMRHLLAPELETIFFGGGTPSMTPPDSMQRALEPLWENSRVTDRTEWTMEANPSSIERDQMKAYREFGVNRVSMGVQAMREDLLKNLGRVHSRDAVIRALDAVFSAGFENVSVDLLCGVPLQGLKDIEEAMTRLMEFPIRHLSCYLLTLPPHHPMYKDLPNEDTQLEHLLFIDQFMTSRGFEHYEISNFAKPGFQAQHNLRYWKGDSYLGLGPSAHSFDSQSSKRWKNFSSLHKYARSLEQNQSVIEWSEELSSEQKHLESWMLALRLSEGFARSWLDTPTRKARAQALEAAGLLESHPQHPDRLRLTARGFSLSDQIITTLA
jgi:oxygen-independent coproporphyrinogen-3 oxidase